MDTKPPAVEERGLGGRGRYSILGLGTAFAIGSAAALSAGVFGVPGKGEFFALIWLAGVAAMFVVPGLPGLIAVVAGATASAAVVDASDGTFGLVFLIVAIVAALVAHGALVGTVFRRVRTLGLNRSLRDRAVLSGGGLALGLAFVFLWFAFELGANPP